MIDTYLKSTWCYTNFHNVKKWNTCVNFNNCTEGTEDIISSLVVVQPFIRNLEYYFLKGHFYEHDYKTYLPPISFDNVDFRRLTEVLRHLTHNLLIAKKKRKGLP